MIIARHERRGSDLPWVMLLILGFIGLAFAAGCADPLLAAKKTDGALLSGMHAAQHEWLAWDAQHQRKVVDEAPAGAKHAALRAYVDGAQAKGDRAFLAFQAAVDAYDRAVQAWAAGQRKDVGAEFAAALSAGAALARALADAMGPDARAALQSLLPMLPEN